MARELIVSLVICGFSLTPPSPLLPIFASFIFHLRTARHCNIIPIISDRSLRDATHLRRNSPLFFRRISHTYTSFFLSSLESDFFLLYRSRMDN